ncbi:MAG: phosphotransferase family protein [Anaerolineae bacterium]|nr:phosphotransferase family protein [Anaerolineae bacterium]
MSSNADAIARALAQLYPSEEHVRILDLTRISDGWETEVYAFAVERERCGGRARETEILRLYPGADAHDKSGREFHAMAKLHQMGYPVPQVLHLEQDSALLGMPFVIMERIDGEPLGVVADRASLPEKRALLTRFCHMFADLHALDWRPFAPDVSLYEALGASGILRRQLAQWHAFTHALQNHTFDPVFAWLEERVASIRCGSPAVIHMDYHPRNVLLAEDGAAYVIDWTNVDVLDHRLDLAWTLLLTSAYGHPEMREIVLDAYQRVAGHEVEQIDYFEVMACARRLFSILVSLGAGAETLGMRPGAEAMMKNRAHIASVYDWLCARTALRIPEVEGLLSALG